MPKMTVEEAKTFLKSDVGLSDEQIGAYTADQLKKLADAHMRQADYDASMNEGKAELAKAQKELADANANFNQELAEFARIQAEGGNVTKKMRADLEKAEQRALRLEQRARTLATDAGLDPVKALEGLDVAVIPTTPTPPLGQPDLTGYVRADDLHQATSALANMALTLPADLQQIQLEHRQLFGTDIDTRTIVREIQARATTKGNTKSLNPREVWEEQHKVETRRAEVAKKTHDDEIAAAEARGRQAAYSESAIPGQASAPGRHSPIFAGERKSAMPRPPAQTRQQRAIGAFSDGRYRPADPAGAKRTA